MKRLFLISALTLCFMSASVIAQNEDGNKGKAKVECCCEECTCKKCVCEEDCSDCNGCRKNEECKECCEEERHDCCDYHRKHYKKHRHGSCCERHC